MAEVGKHCIVKLLPPELNSVLRDALSVRGWEFEPLPYAVFKAVKNKTNVVLYNSGKLVIQGGEAQDFVDFILEPEVMKDLAFQEHQAAFMPHAGMDESGKGDFFGPLVVAAVYVDKKMEIDLGNAGVRDCKQIRSDVQLVGIAADAMKIVKGKVGLVSIGPEAYNRMYGNFRSLNHLLAWGHARALENLLEKVPECSEAIADQFGNEQLLRDNGILLTEEEKDTAETYLKEGAAVIYLGIDGEAAGLISQYQKALFDGADLPERFHRTFGAGDKWEELRL